MISIYVGNTGEGKTFVSAKTSMDLLLRNRRWFEKGRTKIRRVVATNIAINPAIKEEFKDYIVEWTDLEQLVALKEADVIFDDMAAYLDAQRWSDTPTAVKRWLRLHEHYGCDIYGNAQDFLTIDPSVRRLTGSVYHVWKVIGSRRPSSTKPRVRRIWGIILERRVSQEVMDKETIKYEYERGFKVHFITRHICSIFDTTQDLQMGEYPPLHHIERKCIQCGEIKTRHA